METAWRIVHFTSVHIWNDTRVFRRMCRSLAEAGHEVHLIAPCQDKQQAETIDGVHLHPLPWPQSRGERFWRTGKLACELAAQIPADLYHFHDPELIPHAGKLAKQGRCVVYDAHEDLPKDLVDKHWLPTLAGKMLAVPLDLLERRAARRFAGVIAAEETIERRFESRAVPTVSIHNYPRLADFAETLAAPLPPPPPEPWVVSFGGVSRLRAIEPLVDALGHLPDALPMRLILSGRSESDQLMRQLQQQPGFARVDYQGWLSHERMRQMLAQATVALILFSPAPNNYQVRSNRFYESLACGVPVITSDFPDWQAVVQRIGCGICVDPTSSRQIADAITFLLTHPAEARQMGQRGRQAVLQELNWEHEHARLVAFYAEVIRRHAAARGGKPG